MIHFVQNETHSKFEKSEVHKSHGKVPSGRPMFPMTNIFEESMVTSPEVEPIMKDISEPTLLWLDEMDMKLATQTRAIPKNISAELSRAIQIEEFRLLSMAMVNAGPHKERKYHERTATPTVATETQHMAVWPLQGLFCRILEEVGGVEPRPFTLKTLRPLEISGQRSTGSNHIDY